MDTIKFYKIKEPYGEFSNFAPYPIFIDGKEYKTVEHYFQSCKSLDKDIAANIASQPTPGQAAKAGRSREFKLRADWEDIKDAIMYKALQAKFTQYATLTALLVGTSHSKIVEHTSNDRYWADGGDGTGKNRLGQLLMKLRCELT